MGSAAPGIGEINDMTARDSGDRVALRPDVAERLIEEFPILPADTVRRQVEDARVCVRQLGLEATPRRVERVAREHLTHLVRSEPPSGRCGPFSH